MQKREQEATELKLTKKEIEEREEMRQGEMRRELQKAIKRKAEREKEKEARDEEMVRPSVAHLCSCYMYLFWIMYVCIGTFATNERSRDV